MDIGLWVMLMDLFALAIGGASSTTSTTSRTTEIVPAVSYCGGIFTETEFILRSPEYPSNYPHEKSCEWRVVRQSSTVCGLELTFKKFDLEPSDNCSYDYLQVDDINLCGKIADKAVRVFMFAQNETILKFVSDKENSRTGFDIRIRQIKICSPEAKGSGCSQAFDKKDFFIRSPNYPSNYSDNAECNYRIIRHSKRVCALKVTFASFHLEESVNCKSDYFDIEGKKFCGKLEDATTQTFPFQGNEKLLTFKTDSSVSGPGFFAHIQQEECDPRSLQSPDECSQDIR